MARSLPGWVTEDVLAGGGLAVLLAAFIVIALHREAGVPLAVGLLVVPVVVGSGFALALVIHLWLAVNLLYAAAMLSGVLIVFVGLFEALKAWTTAPPPPMGRY